MEDYRKVVERRDGIQAMRDEAGRKFRALEMQLDSLPDTDIQGLRETRRFMSVNDCDIPNAERLCLDDLAAWAAGAVQSGEAA